MLIGSNYELTQLLSYKGSEGIGAGSLSESGGSLDTMRRGSRLKAHGRWNSQCYDPRATGFGKKYVRLTVRECRL
jgi:hypothetical protein